jgi:hypothetical protein
MQAFQFTPPRVGKKFVSRNRMQILPTEGKPLVHTNNPYNLMNIVNFNAVGVTAQSEKSEFLTVKDSAARIEF